MSLVWELKAVKVRETLAVLGVVAVLFGASALVGHLTNDDSSSYVQEGTPSPTVSTAPTALPTLPPHQTVTLFDRIELPYLKEWWGAMSDPGRVENIVDGTHCAMSSAMCPHIMVYNMATGEAVPIEADQCPATLRPASGKLRQLSDVTIDGRAAKVYEQELCPMGKTGAPSVMRHTWDVPGRLRVVATSTTAPLALDDLKAAIANIKWLD